MFELLPHELAAWREVDYLDAVLLGEDGRVKLLPAATLREIKWEDLRLWAHFHAIYQFPTVELVEFLDRLIRKRATLEDTLEIGAGSAALGRFLGIRMTDSDMQRANSDASAYYTAMRQPPTQPAADVERIDALEAIRRYQPRVVLGCWITHQWDPGTATGNYWGVDEVQVVRQAHYIHVGNALVHRFKPINHLPHGSMSREWLVSRAAEQSLNRLQTWERQP